MAFDPRPLQHQFVIASDLRKARQIEDQILDHTQELGYSPECMFAIRLALEEAIVNAHVHGNCSDPTKHITISYEADDRQLTVRVRDDGEGFNPGVIPDPRQPDRISMPFGRGLMLMNAYLDEVCYNQTGNEVQLRKEKC